MVGRLELIVKLVGIRRGEVRVGRAGCGMRDAKFAPAFLALARGVPEVPQKSQLMIAVNKPHCGETEGHYSAGSGTPRRAERFERDFLFGVDS